MKTINVKHPFLKIYNKKAKENEDRLIETMENLIIDNTEPKSSFQRYGPSIDEYKRKKKLEQKSKTFAL